MFEYKQHKDSSPVFTQKLLKDSIKSKPIFKKHKSRVFARKTAKNPEKLIVFQGFCSGQHFYPLNMVRMTGLEPARLPTGF